jgi:hypothetical protein
MQSLVSPMSSADAVPSSQRTAKPPSPKRFLAVRLLLASFVLLAASVGLLTLGWFSDETVGYFGFGVAAVMATVGVFSAIVSLTMNLKLSLRQVALLVTALVGNGLMAFIGTGLTMLSVGTVGRGRQVRRFGRVLLPPLERGQAWASFREALSIPDELRQPLAQAWRENGRNEHASVAAFAQLTLDLMALGAPPRLVRAAQRDALDEIRHAELCFSLARAIDATDVGPGSFSLPHRALPRVASHTLGLARLAVDSLVDGALHEGVSARVIAQLAKRTEVMAVRAVLKELAADEGRHAAHGWEVVDWCVEQGGKPVIDALLAAVRALPTAMNSARPIEAGRGEWERYGIHGYALEVAEYEKARADIERRVLQIAGLETEAA